jgi:4-hydroxybenzoate polyprenyltransferase
MIVAERGLPSWWLMVATVVGGTGAAGGANAINMYVDRDIDAQVARTALRPIPSGRISVKQALAFVVGCSLISLLILLTLNLTAVLLGVASLMIITAVVRSIGGGSVAGVFALGGTASLR